MKNSYRDEIDVFRSIAVIAAQYFPLFSNLLPGLPGCGFIFCDFRLCHLITDI